MNLWWLQSGGPFWRGSRVLVTRMGTKESFWSAVNFRILHLGGRVALVCLLSVCIRLHYKSLFIKILGKLWKGGQEKLTECYKHPLQPGTFLTWMSRITPMDPAGFVLPGVWRCSVCVIISEIGKETEEWGEAQSAYPCPSPREECTEEGTWRGQ